MNEFSRRDFFLGMMGGLGSVSLAFGGKKEDDEEYNQYNKDLIDFEKLAKKAEKVGISSTELKDLKNGYASTQQSYNWLLLSSLVLEGYVRIIRDERCETRCIVTWFPPTEIKFGNIEDRVRLCCQMADTDFDRIVTDQDALAFLKSTVSEYGTKG